MPGRTTKTNTNITSERRITVLDGWRGVSILLVILGHLVVYRSANLTGALERQVGDVCATLGVCIFFAISGFIITKLALRERQLQGQLSVRDFYLRRALRILPPFYVYLLCIVVLTGHNYIAQNASQTAQAALFMCDLPNSDCGWFAGHSWSLAYEEQFYVLFPLTFVALGKRFLGVFSVVLFALLGVPVMRWVLNLGPPWYSISHATFNLSFIGVGVLLGVVGDRLKQFWEARHVDVVFWAAVLVMALVMTLDVASHLHPHSGRLLHARMILCPTLEPVCVALLLFTSMQWVGIVQRVLNSPPLQFIGLISYSLYLWQQLFTGAPPAYLHQSWVWSPPLMFVIAALSYYFIERPCVRLARRLSHPRTGPLLPVASAAVKHIR